MLKSMNWCLISITEAMRRVVRQVVVLIFVCAITTVTPAQQLNRPVGEPPTGKNYPVTSTFRERQGPLVKLRKQFNAAETVQARRPEERTIPAHVINRGASLEGWKDVRLAGRDRYRDGGRK